METSLLSLSAITPSEVIWLTEIIKAYLKREKIDHISLKIRLNDKLDKNFDYKKIDHLLIINEVKPTLLTIRLIEPNNPIIQTAEKVLRQIKEDLIKNPELRRFDSSSISSQLNYRKDDMDLCFEQIYSLHIFFNSASSSSNKVFGFQSIESTAIESINKILEFEDLELIFSDLVFQIKTRKESKKETRPTAFATPNTILNSGFIIIRMDKEYTEGEDVCNTIKEVCNSFGINAIRADDIEHSDLITDVIIDKIKTSEFIIADLTGEKPNVYYEIGYAHAINKRPIMYRNKESNIHFDLAGYNVPEYSNLSDLKRQLTKRFSDWFGKHSK
jgi:hypothetical protein